MGTKLNETTNRETDMKTQIQQQMENRAANGLDPLSGRPMQVAGPISADSDGKCRDANGTEVTLSSFGDWVPCAS